MNKKELRKQYLGLRSEFKHKKEADDIIFQKLLDVCSEASSIFTYINYKDEVNTVDFIENMLHRGKRVFVPVCNTVKCTMKACEITSLSNLKPNKYGILEPDISLCDSIDIKFDVIIFPGAVFDITGNRIGYGKGYYDKFVDSLDYCPLKLGVCYDFQLLNSVPCDEHDVKMNLIITDTRTVNIV